EELALGEISTGAQNDLQRATDIARAMVTEFGMSDALGAINYDGNKRPRFLDIPMPQERGLYGEETAQLIDAEIKRILTDAHDKARAILTTNRDKPEIVTPTACTATINPTHAGQPPRFHTAAGSAAPTLPPA